MQFRLFYVLSTLLACSTLLYSQSDNNNLNPSHFFSLAPTIQTNGIGLNIKWGRAANQSRFNFYTVDLSKIRHQKEFRYLGNGRYNGFVFGRKNVAMPVNLGFGKYYVLGVRNSKNDVGLAWTYQLGASMVLLKPVYLWIDEKPGTLNSNEKRVRYNGESNLDLGNILGGESFFTGLNQLQVVPGVFARASVLFSWGKYYNDYHALEIGALMEVYSKELPLMAYTKNSFIYPSFYINFNLGKFW